jgi:hypothetical protein
MYLSRARPIHSNSPSPISTRSILMLATHLLLGLPSGIFPSGFPTSNLNAFLFSPLHATGPAHHILLAYIILIILCKEYKSHSSSLCSFPHLLMSSSLFGPNILLSTQFSNSFSICHSLSVRDQVSHPFRTRGKIIVLCIPIFKFFESRKKAESSGLNGSKLYQNSVSPFFPSRIKC